MADSTFIAMTESPKGEILVEPSPVTRDNISILCDSMVFTYPRNPDASSVSLVKCIEEVIDYELDKGTYTSGDLLPLMKIEGDLCELKQEFKDRLRAYQLERSKLIEKKKKLDLNRDVRKSLDKIVKLLNSMKQSLESVSDALKCVKGTNSAPISAFSVSINGNKESLSIQDEIRYLQVFKCQTMLLQLGIVAVHQPSLIKSESKAICSNVSKILNGLELVTDSLPIIACRDFLNHYVSYLWNISYIYQCTGMNSSDASGGEKDLLEAKACITRHCINELQYMLNVSNGRTLQKSITAAQSNMRVSLNCILMMNYYKNFNYRMAYRAHKRTLKLMQRDRLPWLDKFKKVLDSDMILQMQSPLASWDEDIFTEDDAGEFGRPRGVKIP